MNNLQKFLRYFLIPTIFIVYHLGTFYEIINNNYFFTLISPLVILALGFVIHALDDKYRLRGIKDVYKNGRTLTTTTGTTTSPGNKKYVLTTDIISASMTKQSIFAAISVATLLYEISVLLNNSQDYLSKIQTYLKSFTVTYLGNIWKVLSLDTYFKNNILLLSIILLSLSVLLTVVSILCYDYSIRFDWTEPEKKELLYKALRLDTYSFYSLTTAIIYFLGSVNPFVLIFFNVFWGGILYYYYFFR